MDQNDGFYVHLCSSDSMGTYPKNTCSNFVNLLAKPLDLDTNWEVGLTEFQYTNSIYNVTANSNFALFDFLYEWEDKDEFGKKTTYWGRLYDAKVPEGNYDEVTDFCKILNRLVDEMQIERFKGHEIFTYDKVAKKFHINVKDRFVTIIAKEHLINILGLAKKESHPGKVAIVGKSKKPKYYEFKGKKRYFRNQRDQWDSDAEEGGIAFYCSQMIIVSSLLLYTPIIADSIFGSNFVQLLRIVPVTGHSNERVVHSFRNIIYYPLRESMINYIPIEIRDYSGAPVNFLTDNIYLLLHFRPIKK